MEKTVRACDVCGRYDAVLRFQVELGVEVVGDVEETRLLEVDWCPTHTASAVLRLLNTVPMELKRRWIEDLRNG